MPRIVEADMGGERKMGILCFSELINFDSVNKLRECSCESAKRFLQRGKRFWVGELGVRVERGSCGSGKIILES